MAESGRSDVSFWSGDEECRAWLFRPAARPAPLVILGHGLGATREMRLDAYAARFAAAGIAALAFTHRHFGDSGGQPRQLLDIGLQLEDWAAALTYARALDGIDPDRVAIWGSAFGGGHVIEVAARDQRVAAVVSQCPFTDGIASLRAVPPRTLLRLARPAAWDELARLRGSTPVLLPLTGAPGDAAVMTSHDAQAGMERLFPPDARPDDRIAARFLNRVPFYRPGRSARAVTCPILFCLCDDDTVAPAQTALKDARTAPRGEVRRYPVGHFDIYHDAPFEQAVSDQAAFLTRTLSPASPQVAKSAA